MQQSTNISDAVLVTTSVAMDRTEEQAITKKVMAIVGGTPSIAFAVDEHILGGIQIEHNGALVDMSLRSELDALVATIKT